MTEDKKIGTVKWYNEKKGFGFIVPHEAGKDVFVHATAIEASGLNEIKEGQQIAYLLKPSRGGKVAASDLELVK